MGVYSFKSSGNIVSRTTREGDPIPTRNPIGIRTPLRLDDKNLFAMHYNIEDQIHDNLRNLLLTNWGEKVGFYDYGANLQALTSELPNIDAFDNEAIDRIRTAVSAWMPFISLNEFTSELDNESNKNVGIVKIKVTYNIPKLNIENKALQISLYVI